MSVEQETKGRGYIRVDIPTWEAMEKPETPEQWHKVLLLPDDYEVIEGEPYCYEGSETPIFYEVLVTHEDIPISEAPRTSKSYIVNPVYRAEYHEGDKKAFLDRIEIWRWSEDDKWKQVK